MIMRQLLMLAAVAGLAMARPELYREKEDFQFTRSSTDEGSKSGFYDAQRGNMGGNYERAHNMDPLAQNQMSGLVRTVEGELGSGAKQQTGSVYTSANSRGVYGSNNYDLSNLGGRNFQEGSSYGTSGSLQSQSSSTSHSGSAAYRGQHLASTNTAGYSSSPSQSYNLGHGQSHSHDSRYGGYNTAGNLDQVAYSNNQQRSDNLQSASQYDRNTAQNTGYAASGSDSGYYSQAAGYHKGQVYDQSSSLAQSSSDYGSNIHSRLVSGTPVRISIRPGTKVVVPVAAETYDAAQSSSFDQNAYKSKSEMFNGNDQQVVLQPHAKHYQSSYSYRKEWEKQDTKPVSGAVPIPTLNPYPRNSELYEDAQAQTLDQQQHSASGIASQSHHSSHSGYNVKSSQSRQAEYDARHLGSSGTNTGSSAYHGAYNGGSTGVYNRDANGAYIGASNLNQVEDSNTKPKGYQSSYSYHKSWERQGDPYVIKPSTNGLYEGQVSSRLTDGSMNQGAYGNSNQYGSQHHHQSHQRYSSNSDADCDENDHIRVARSYNTHQNPQRTRSDIIGQEDYNLENLGQQTQQKSENLEDLGQQTQQEWVSLADLGQQPQQKWDNLENLGQQTQQKTENLEDIGQQTQETWANLKVLRQPTQKKWDKIEDLRQQTHNAWDKLQDEGQQTQTLWDQQETENRGDKLKDFGQQIQSQSDGGQQTQRTWELQSQTDPGQETQDGWILETALEGNDDIPIEQKSDTSRQENHGIGHQSDENTFKNVQSPNYQTHNTESHTLEGGIHHHTHTIWDEIKKEEIGQENEDSVESDLAQTGDLDQQIHNSFASIINTDENRYKHHESAHRVQMDLTNSEANQHNIFDTPNPHPWMYNQVHHHNTAHSNQDFAHTWQEHSTSSMNSNSFNFNGHSHFSGSTSGSSIMGLWDKLDTIEKETILSHSDDDETSHVRQENIANIFGTQHNDQHSTHDFSNNDNQRVEGAANAFDSHVQRDVFDSQIFINPLQPNKVSTTAKPSTTTTKISPLDIGRGDIEPEDITNEQIESERDSKPYKTQEQIETLSLTKEISKTEKPDVMQDINIKEDKRDFSVISLDQHQDKGDASRHDSASVTVPTSTTQIINNHYMHTNEEKETRNMEHQFEEQGQVNLDQQTLLHQFEDGQVNEHHNSDQLMEFGQHSENTAEQAEQQFETQNIGQSESFHQGNKIHDSQNFGQQREQFDQVSLSGWKADETFNQQEHKLTNWGQENENIEQQRQSGLTENMDHQQVQTVWNPTEDLQQQSQLAETFGQPIEDLSQQTQPAWKPTEDLQQHSQLTETFGQPTEDLSQQIQPAWKPIEDLQQHSQLNKEFTPPMENLNQQAKTAWVPEDLQQQSQLTESFSQPMDQNKEETSDNKHAEVVEELIVPKKVAAVDSPPEVDVVTEKPGFWKSIGSKFTNAKEKVSSWFSS